MRLDHAAIVLRPRGTLGSADLAFRFVLAVRPRLWALLAAVTLLPGFGLCLLLQLFYRWEWFPIWCVALAYGTLAQGVFSTAAGLLMFDRGVRAGVVLRRFAVRLLPYAGAMLWTRALALGLSTFVGLGIYLWVRWAYVPESVLLEQASLFRAGGRSSDFTKGHIEGALGVLCLTTGFNAAAAIAFEQLGHGIEQLLMLPVHADDLWSVGGSPYALLGYFVSLPLVAVLRFLSYIDGRTRRDGWDIQVRFMALAAEAERKTSLEVAA